MGRWMGWTHAQELDRLELGDDPARCLKGENHEKASPGQRERLIAGRALRGLSEQRRDHLLGPRRKPFWFQVEAERLAEAEAAEKRRCDLEREIERLQRRERAYQLSLREVADQGEAERRVLRKKIAALERERTRLTVSLSVVEKVARRATGQRELHP